MKPSLKVVRPLNLQKKQNIGDRGVTPTTPIKFCGLL